MLANKLRIILPLSFFILIIYIIFLADTANYNFAFRLIGDIPYGDKFMHFLLYGIMAFLLNHGFNYKSYKTFSCDYQVGATIVFLFASIEEFSQFFIASRTFDSDDILADLFGVILFSFFRIK